MANMNFNSRRTFVTMLALAGGLSLIPLRRLLATSSAATEGTSDDEWRKRLTAEQYHILREQGTEAPFTSPLNKEKREGVFHCAGCNTALFTSDMKFDSGTGWPSFFDSLPNVLATREDTTYFMVRTEYHCATCGGHHGHVFNDGPQPTGLRYCNNGAALVFVPKQA